MSIIPHQLLRNLREFKYIFPLQHRRAFSLRDLVKISLVPECAPPAGKLVQDVEERRFRHYHQALLGKTLAQYPDQSVGSLLWSVEVFRWVGIHVL